MNFLAEAPTTTAQVQRTVQTTITGEAGPTTSYNAPITTGTGPYFMTYFLCPIFMSAVS